MTQKDVGGGVIGLAVRDSNRRLPAVHVSQLLRQANAKPMTTRVSGGGSGNLPPFKISRHQLIVDQRFAARPAPRTDDL